MCIMPSVKTPAPQAIAAYDNSESIKSADAEARLRRRRAGAAAYVLTGPSGIPSTSTMGGVAA